MTEDEMVGCYHRLNGHEFEYTLRDGEGQGGLARWSPNDFSTSIDMLIFLFISPLIWWTALIDFQTLNQPFIPGVF